MTDFQAEDSRQEDPVAVAAKTVFGVSYLYPYQRLVIANILDAAESSDRLRQMVLLPTGYGKSLCFQLPAVLLPGLTLAVYPLRSLMADQARRLRERGVVSVLLQGGLEDGERRRSLEEIRTGRARIALANPEILRTEAVLSLLRTAGVAHAVVDEAHCVAEWGDDFRPAYQDLGDILRSLDPLAITAFTATASPAILARTADVLFGDAPWRVISGDPDRPNLRYACAPTLCKAHTLARLARSLPKPLLVFCASRAGTQIAAEDLARALGSREVRFYHAGMTKPERGAVEAWFLPSRDGILTATCAFGMGIDKPDIRSVIHADPPPSVESYLQESGRAGRDGKPSQAVLVVHPQDRDRLRVEEDPVRRQRRKAVLDYAEGTSSCRRETLLQLLGTRVDACSGCDVCFGLAAPSPEGRDEILRFATANPGRCTIPEAARRISGRSDPCAWAGALPDWDPAHAAEALAYLAGNGEIRVPGRGPWRGRVRPAAPRGANRLSKKLGRFFGTLVPFRGSYRDRRMGLPVIPPRAPPRHPPAGVPEAEPSASPSYEAGKSGSLRVFSAPGRHTGTGSRPPGRPPEPPGFPSA